jgi:hypothetical protein
MGWLNGFDEAKALRGLHYNINRLEIRMSALSDVVLALKAAQADQHDAVVKELDQVQAGIAKVADLTAKLADAIAANGDVPGAVADLSAAVDAVKADTAALKADD